MKEVGGVFSDDDTDFEYMYLLAMEAHGPEPTYAQMAAAWRRHVHDRVWLANRAALALMHVGYSPPVTGRRDRNPHWFQIDPQLVNEVWAVTAPGMVRYAAEKSLWAARITSDGFGVEPTVHYGAMYAAAFFETDVAKLVDAGTAALPPGSRFATTVEEMKRLHRLHPGDWRKARHEIAARYYRDEPLETKTIWNANLNGAAGILALLYGGGDFQRTLDLACAMGFDADNQAATMAGLVALARGREAIPKVPGLALEGGEIAGIPTRVGTFRATIAVRRSGKEASRMYRFVVRPENLAPAARRVLASVTRTNYSIGDGEGPKKDHYGYEWTTPQAIGLLSFHSGAVEEVGGWFTSLDVQYRDTAGSWAPVRGLTTPFTSITELGVYGPVPALQGND
jgi:hypothetical protein